MHSFLVDESSGKKLAIFLNKSGYDTTFVGDLNPGASDKEVLTLADKEKRILVTNDKDFGELIFRLGLSSSGVILLRLTLDTPKSRYEHILHLIKNYSQKLHSHFFVVTEGKVRIRKMKNGG